jgi:hypothetical protein
VKVSQAPPKQLPLLQVAVSETPIDVPFADLLHTFPGSVPFVALAQVPTVQVVPANPGLQAHVKELVPSVQTPAFWQGFGEHSLTLV